MGKAKAKLRIGTLAPGIECLAKAGSRAWSFLQLGLRFIDSALLPLGSKVQLQVKYWAVNLSGEELGNWMVPVALINRFFMI